MQCVEVCPCLELLDWERVSESVTEIVTDALQEVQASIRSAQTLLRQEKKRRESLEKRFQKTSDERAELQVCSRYRPLHQGFLYSYPSGLMHFLRSD